MRNNALLIDLLVQPFITQHNHDIGSARNNLRKLIFGKTATTNHHCST